MPDMSFVASMTYQANIPASAEKTAERAAEITPFTVEHMPPETLGYIFQMSVDPVLPRDDDPRFAGIQKAPYNFLLVCRRWYQVARCTPELWSSWGNNLGDWKRCYLYNGASPLDLILDWFGHQTRAFDESLKDALKSRATRDLIRKVHLRGPDLRLLTSIISSLTPGDEGIRHSSIESIVLHSVDISDFLTRHRFPKLQGLDISRCSDLVLNHLKSHTMALIDLSLNNMTPHAESVPTTSQILSLLTSNPHIQTITLFFLLVSGDIESSHRFRVPLRHLKSLSLSMDFRCALSILQRLELPDRMGKLQLSFDGCTLEGIRRDIGPYIRDHFQCHERHRDRLCVFVEIGIRRLLIQACVVGFGDEIHNRSPPHTTFAIKLPDNTSGEERDKLSTDIFEFLPQELIVFLETNLSAGAMKKLLINMPNIEVFNLSDPVVSSGFLLPDPGGPNAHKKLLPSLRLLRLEYRVGVGSNDWSPLIRYLTHQTSGNQPVSLIVSGDEVHICWEVQMQIGSLIEGLAYFGAEGKQCRYCSG